MRFGDQSRFAVEFEIDESRTQASACLLGHFCYWINGDVVGDFKLLVTLSDLIHPLATIVKDCGSRQGEASCGMLSDDLFRLLHASMYGNPDFNEASAEVFPEPRAKFDILPHEESFDEWIGYLVACGSLDILAYWRVDAPKLSYAALPSGEFDTVVLAAFSALNAEADRRTLS